MNQLTVAPMPTQSLYALFYRPFPSKSKSTRGVNCSLTRYPGTVVMPRVVIERMIIRLRRKYQTDIEENTQQYESIKFWHRYM